QQQQSGLRDSPRSPRPAPSATEPDTHAPPSPAHAPLPPLTLDPPHKPARQTPSSPSWHIHVPPVPWHLPPPKTLRVQHGPTNITRDSNHRLDKPRKLAHRATNPLPLPPTLNTQRLLDFIRAPSKNHQKYKRLLMLLASPSEDDLTSPSTNEGGGDINTYSSNSKLCNVGPAANASGAYRARRKAPPTSIESTPNNQLVSAPSQENSNSTAGWTSFSAANTTCLNSQSQGGPRSVFTTYKRKAPEELNLRANIGRRTGSNQMATSNQLIGAFERITAQESTKQVKTTQKLPTNMKKLAIHRKKRKNFAPKLKSSAVVTGVQVLGRVHVVGAQVEH
ncbi:hypothetical protein PCASD_21873, partial [Puccinia coronata f. sp. avenae]